MRQKKHLVLAALLLIASPAFPQWIDPTKPPPFTLSITPGGILPMGRDSAVFPYGYALQLSGVFRFAPLPILFISTDLGFQNLALKGIANPFLGPLLFDAGVEAGFTMAIMPGLSMRVYGEGGGFYGFLLGVGGSDGYNPFVSGGAGLSYSTSPYFSIGLEASYLMYVGLYSGLTASLGASFHIPAVILPLSIPEEPPQQKGLPPVKLSPLEQETAKKTVGGLDLDALDLNSVFPIFYKYYTDHPVGKATLHNWGKAPLENITVSFFAKQYMENPKPSTTIKVLPPGATQDVDLYGLFRSNILDISEQTLVSSNITVEYAVNGKAQKRDYTRDLRILDRNAMTWDDDRRAAAFVTVKDPTVLKFSKNVMSIVKGKAGGALNQNFLAALGIHQALSAYGLAYVVDPATPHVQFSQSKTAVDFLQFSEQTLEYKAGDCDDLSILYCSLFESIGIPTAFITIPGHIYMAFSINMKPEDARNAFQKPEDLIFQQDTTWIPIEVTQREGGFLKAWEVGAKEWRDNLAAGHADFYALTDCWAKYEAVGFSATVAPIVLPAEDVVAKSFTDEVTRFVNREISPKVQSLQDAIAKSPTSVQLINKLAVLYAQYGSYDNAEHQLSKIASKSYLPALINLGNLRYLRGDPKKALQYYQQAQKIEPNNAKVLLGLARCYFDLESNDAATKAYILLQGVAPDIAAQFSYIGSGTQETARAADVNAAKEVMLWAE